MSQLEREKESKVSNGRKSNATTQKTSKNYFTSYNPSKQEKQEIMEMKESLEEILDFLSTYCQDRFTVSFKFMESQECYAWIIRENTGDWQSQRSLTCWHVDWEKALKMLYHGLSNRYKLWPNMTDIGESYDTEW